MWVAWYIVGMLLLITKRYVKKPWKFNHLLHAILGYFTLIVTIVFSLKVTEWDPFKTTHNAMGTATLFITIFGSISGIATAVTMQAYNGDKPWTKKERVEKVAKIHRIAGYTMLFIGNGTIASGLGYYYGKIMEGDGRKVLGVMSVLSFVLFVMIFESIFRIRNKYG